MTSAFFLKEERTTVSDQRTSLAECVRAQMNDKDSSDIAEAESPPRGNETSDLLMRHVVEFPSDIAVAGLLCQNTVRYNAGRNNQSH